MFTVKSTALYKKHSWTKGQCPDCHYFGLYKFKETNHGWAGSRRRGFKSTKGVKITEYHYINVTEKNIDLYCKLSQIIRNKPCKPKMVLSQQKISNRVRNKDGVLP